jgi:hypothetical protein
MLDPSCLGTEVTVSEIDQQALLQFKIAAANLNQTIINERNVAEVPNSLHEVLSHTLYKRGIDLPDYVPPDVPTGILVLRGTDGKIRGTVVSPAVWEFMKMLGDSAIEIYKALNRNPTPTEEDPQL